MSELPTLVAHADWSVSAPKRWMARATFDHQGVYHAHEPAPVGYLPNMIRHLMKDAGPHGSVSLGFDFPIGLPSAYARRVGISDYVDLLPELGQGEWAEFYQVAELPSEISPWRPFYPQRPGGSR